MPPTYLMALLCLPAAAEALPFTAVPAIDNPQLDGRLDAEEWGLSAYLGPFLRADGAGMPDAPTHARLGRTSSALWLGVDCREPKMSRLQAVQRDRDSQVWVDDCVEVFVQRPGARYRHFVVNAAGAQYDEEEKDSRWDGDWRAQTSRHESGWQIELELPFNALGGAPREGEEWRLNVCRGRRPEPELSAWSATGGGFHVPERFGRVLFATQPVATSIAWRVTSRRTGEVHVTWHPSVPEVALTVNGTPTDGAFSLAGEGALTQVLEGRQGATTILVASTVVTLPALDEAFADAAARLARLPAEGPLGERRSALEARLATLRELADRALGEAAVTLAAEARRVAALASRLAVRAALDEAGAKPAGITYGVETSLVKLLRDQPFQGRAGGPVRLDAARAEMDAAQLVLFAGEAPLLGVRAEVGQLKTDDAATLPAESVRIRRVGYVRTVKPSYAVDHIGLWPDPLLPLTPFDVPVDGFETLWVDVRVPTGAAPGIYRGELTLTALTAETTVVPIEVRVRNFVIPAQPSLRTAFGLGRPNWRVPQDQDAYVRNLLEHRVSPYAVGSPKLVAPPASDWRGADRIEVSIDSDRPGRLTLIVTPAEGSVVVFDGRDVPAGTSITTYDLGTARTLVRSWQVSLVGPQRATASIRLLGDRPRVLAERREARARVAEDGWLAAWPTWEGSGWDQPDRPAEWDWSGFDGPLETYLPLGLTGHVLGIPQPRGPRARAWQEHLAARGWLHLGYTYLHDEPEPKDYPMLNQVMGEVKRAAPGIMNMMTARRFPPELHYVDIWCPEVYSFDPDAARAEQAKGKAVWWYVAFSTRHPYPDVWVDYPALDCRVWPWMTWKHDLDGMLYWSVNYWHRNDPWRCAETFPGANGDGSLLYPGEDGRPVDSLRWECLRDGLEDYEVFCLLEAGARELRAAGGDPGLVERANALLAIDPGVVASYREYNPDPAALLAAREQMSDTLEAIVAALGHEPVISGRPRHRPGVDLAQVPPEPEPEGEMVAWEPPATQPEEGLVLRYALDDLSPLAADLSGLGMHGLVHSATRCDGVSGGGLRFAGDAGVTLPAGAALLGDLPREGTVMLWARPAFEPDELSSDQWDGYRVLFYLMQTDGNGLPDGYDEIGLYLHGPRLFVRCAGQAGAFAQVESPLRRGVWTHLAITWAAERRVLYVDGRALAEANGAYPPPKLDGFAGALGIHPPSRRWSWQGDLDEFRIYRRTLTADEIAALARR